MSRLDETTLQALISTRRPERGPARSAGDRMPSDRGALDLVATDTRPPSHDNARVSAIQEARRDLRALKVTVRRLTADCDTIVRQSEVRPGDAPAPRNRGRNALHLQARADAVAALIQETERVLNQLEARG